MERLFSYHRLPDRLFSYGFAKRVLSRVGAAPPHPSPLRGEGAEGEAGVGMLASPLAGKKVIALATSSYQIRRKFYATRSRTASIGSVFAASAYALFRSACHGRSSARDVPWRQIWQRESY